MVCVGFKLFKLFLHRGISTVHEFSCTRNAVCVHVTCTVVTVHTICEDLRAAQGCDQIPGYRDALKHSFLELILAKKTLKGIKTVFFKI